MIYHITYIQDWNRALSEGFFTHESLQSEGFIHFSTAEQLERTAHRFYKNQQDLILLHVDDSKLKAELKYEPADNDMFPHLFGELNLDAVVKTEVLTWKDDQLVRGQESS